MVLSTLQRYSSGKDKERLKKVDGGYLRSQYQCFEDETYRVVISLNTLCDSPSSNTGVSTSTINIVYKPRNSSWIVRRNSSSLEFIALLERSSQRGKLWSGVESVLSEISEDIDTVAKHGGVLVYNKEKDLWAGVPQDYKSKHIRFAPKETTIKYLLLSEAGDD